MDDTIPYIAMNSVGGITSFSYPIGRTRIVTSSTIGIDDGSVYGNGWYITHFTSDSRGIIKTSMRINKGIVYADPLYFR